MIKEVHVTRDGNEIPIKELTDDHLEKIVMFMIRKLQECKTALNNPLSRFDKIFNGPPQKDVQAVEHFVRKFRENLTPYVMEMFFRGMDLKKASAAIVTMTAPGMFGSKISLIAENGFWIPGEDEESEVLFT